jgi:hypothetical protein
MLADEGDDGVGAVVADRAGGVIEIQNAVDDGAG